MSVLLSVIIPTFYAESSIERLLYSLEKQDLHTKLWEVIIIDDGSQDQTVLKAKEYRAHSLLTINMVSLHQNQGNGIAKNLGVRQAKGKYVLFLDDHVYLDDRTTLATFLQEMRRGEYDAICGYYSSSNQDDGNVVRDLRRHYCYGKETSRAITWANWTTFSIVVGGGVRTVFATVPFPETFGQHSAEDTYWQLRAMAAGYQLGFSDKMRVTHDHNLGFLQFLSKVHTELAGVGDLLHMLAEEPLQPILPKMAYFLEYRLLYAVLILASVVWPGWLVLLLGVVLFDTWRLYYRVRHHKSVSAHHKLRFAVTLAVLEVVRIIYLPVYLLVTHRSLHSLLYFVQTIIIWNFQPRKQIPQKVSYELS